MDVATKNQGDIPHVLAVSLLAALLAGLCYFAAPELLMLHLKRWDFYLASHTYFVFLLTVAISIDLVAIYSITAKWLGINQQGRRLEILTGKSVEREERQIPLKLPIIVSLVSSVIAFVVIGSDILEVIPSWLEGNLFRAFILGTSLAFGLAAGLACYMVQALLGVATKKRAGTLPPFPEVPNSIVIGSSGEDLEGVCPAWETLPKHALMGGILITGSIGSGKTQGSIIPILSQALNNFDPKPSVLAIDPKSTFLRKARELIIEKGSSDFLMDIGRVFRS